MPEDVEWLSQPAAAKRLGVEPQYLHTLAEAGIPHQVRGARRVYPFPAATHWFAGWQAHVGQGRTGPAALAAAAARVGGEGGTGMPSAEDMIAAAAREQVAKALEQEAKAEQRVLAVQLARGELVALEDLARELEDTLRPLRAGLTNFPARWAEELVGCASPGEVRRILDRAVEELMHLLARSADEDLPPEVDPPDADPPDPAPVPASPKARTAKAPARKASAAPRRQAA